MSNETQIDLNTYSVDRIKALLYDLNQNKNQLESNIKIAEQVLKVKIQVEERELAQKALEKDVVCPSEVCPNGKCEEAIQQQL